MPRYHIKLSRVAPGSLLGDEFTLRPDRGPGAVTRALALLHCEWLMENMGEGQLEFVELYEDGVLIRRIERHIILPKEVTTI